MSAPGARHEHRRRLLADTATLAGLTVPAVLPRGLEPDVARRHPRSPRLLLGDAKDTETPGCAATARRLRRYGAALVDPVRAGTTARLALAVATDAPSTLRAWVELLHEVTRPLPAGAAGHLDVDDHTTLVWVDLATRTRMSTT